MSSEELVEVKNMLEPFLEQAAAIHQLDMVFIMITNILEESSYMLCYGSKDGKNAKEQLAEAFGLPEDTQEIILAGVVSRKKQLIPTFVTSLQKQ